MKTVPTTTILLTIAVACGTFPAGTILADEKPGAAVKWEYRILTKEQVMDLGKKDLTAGLNKLGDDGWELVVVEPAYVFKRQKQPDVTRLEDARRRLLQAETDVEMWKERIAWSERMVKKGYLTETRLQEEKGLMKAAEAALEKARRDAK
jgi:hypothetical protein